jgi:hypothetical protein
MAGVALTDGDVAALARQAVDLLDPEIPIDVEPADSVDPYRWGRQAWLVWPLVDAGRAFGIYLYSEQTPVEALAHLVDQLSNDVSETERFWGQPFPPCAAGHRHPAEIDEVENSTVVLRCPRTGEVVRRLVPDLPA